MQAILGAELGAQAMPKVNGGQFGVAKNQHFNGKAETNCYVFEFDNEIRQC